MIGGRVRMLQGWEEERAMMGGGDEDEDEDEDEEEGVEVRPSDGWSEATAKALYPFLEERSDDCIRLQ